MKKPAFPPKAPAKKSTKPAKPSMPPMPTMGGKGASMPMMKRGGKVKKSAC